MELDVDTTGKTIFTESLEERMSKQNNLSKEQTPEEQLEEAKRTISSKINTTKLLISNKKKDIRSYEKLHLEQHPDKQEKIDKAVFELNDLIGQQAEIELDLKELNRSEKDQKFDDIKAALHVVKTKAIDSDPSLAYIIQDNVFINVVENSTIRERQNICLEKFTPKEFIQLMAANYELESWNLPEHFVIDLFNKSKRTYKYQRFSIDSRRWKDGVYQPIKYMRDYFIDKMVLDKEEQEFSKDTLSFFDWLMYSLSGGKEENQREIEKWLVHKVINYQKAVNTPDIIIVGHVGGNGKGILQAILKQVFPAMLSGKANAKTLNGNFNAIMVGKLILIFDDQNSREIPLEVVKQLAGSDTMIIELKGEDQYEGEKTHSSAWFSQYLPFRLTPAGQEGGVDRRFSIFRTNITFLESIQKFYGQEQNREISVEEAKDLAEVIVSQFLLNRVCIAYWFTHLMKKYPEIDENFTLKAFHGEDYHYFLDLQKDKLTEIFNDLIVPVLKSGGVVPTFVIRELLKLANEEVKSEKTLKRRLHEMASQVGLLIDTDERTLIIDDGSKLTKKKCTIVFEKTFKGENRFDWSLVSNQLFTRATFGNSHITEDNVIFGIKDNYDEEETDEVESLSEKASNFVYEYLKNKKK